MGDTNAMREAVVRLDAIANQDEAKSVTVRADDLRAILALLAIDRAAGVVEECPSCGGLNTSCPEGCGRDPVTGELDGSTLAASPPAPADASGEVLAWFGTQHRLSLDFYSPWFCDDDDQAQEWRVSKESGPRNDREWEIVGRGETPLEAMTAALAQEPRP